MKPMSAKPTITIAHVEGSGTALVTAGPGAALLQMNAARSRFTPGWFGKQRDKSRPTLR
jgi:hypothetical protein